MNATQEVWRAVSGYEGFYEVSNKGRVRSLDLGRDLTVGVLSDGRRSVRFFRNGKTQGKYLHVLVLETFGGPRPAGTRQGYHFDDDLSNNSIENLRWGRPPAELRLCQIPGCDLKHLARGMCRNHYVNRYAKGVPLDRYLALLERQNGVCAICCRPHPKFFLDHDHACCPSKDSCCGECVRGLLCPSCNTKMAAIDDPVFMEAAPRYLAMNRIAKFATDEAIAS